MNQVIYLRALSDASVAPCLVLVDMQQEYVTGSRLMALPDADQALSNCRVAVRSFQNGIFTSRPPPCANRLNSGAISTMPDSPRRLRILRRQPRGQD